MKYKREESGVSSVIRDPQTRKNLKKPRRGRKPITTASRVMELPKVELGTRPVIPGESLDGGIILE